MQKIILKLQAYIIAITVISCVKSPEPAPVPATSVPTQTTVTTNSVLTTGTVIFWNQHLSWTCTGPTGILYPRNPKGTIFLAHTAFDHANGFYFQTLQSHGIDYYTDTVGTYYYHTETSLIGNDTPCPYTPIIQNGQFTIIAATTYTIYVP